MSTLRLDGGKWSASSHRNFTPPPRRTLAPTEYDAEWADLRSGLDILNRSKIYCSCQESKPGWSRPQPSYYCPTSIPRNTFRGSTIKRGINTHEFYNTSNNSKFYNTSNNSKYPSKYGRNLCPLIRNTEIISVHCKLRLWFLTPTHFQRQNEIVLQASYVSCKAYLKISIKKKTGLHSLQTWHANQVQRCACSSHA
jgi:hypothetical protein